MTNRFKVTQTYTEGSNAGVENQPSEPKFFDTLEGAGEYIRTEQKWDEENSSFVTPIEYRLYEEIPAQYIRRNYVMNSIALVD